MAPEQRFLEETSHLVSEDENLLAREAKDVRSSGQHFSCRGFSDYRAAALSLILLFGTLVSLLALLAHQALNCSSSEGWAARLVCDRRSSLRGADLSHPLLLEAQNDSGVDDVGSSAHDADSAFCNPEKPVTGSGWNSRAWDLEDGFKLVCEARNRVKDHWKIRFSTEDRNWCWVGIKDMCHHSIHRPQNWDVYRDEAFQQSLAPSSSDSPFDPLENPRLCDGTGGDVPSFSTPEEEEANTWFKKHVKVYVVSLGKSQGNPSEVSTRLLALGIEAIPVDGADMADSGMLEKAKAAGWVPKAFNFTAAQQVADGPQFKEGSMIDTLGSASAHFKAQDQIVKDSAPLGLVLEDDSYLIDGFVSNLWRIVTTELPCDWDILQLSARCPYGKCISQHLARIRPDGNEPDWRCHAGVNLGMSAMLYRRSSLPAVQELWKATSFNEKSPHCLDVDVALASISDRVGYYAIPNTQSLGIWVVNGSA
eukprot:TRINITY_DN3762_c0_g1_i1.p1 TRINITY_DN3762_c0_g1~~TRINITY_DN3762_c0_g1_i1.p1  ORF type:complete len:495 (-),score=88.73 TRINITY_DN3762_c0_g1_i1:315-1751(-)